MFRLATCYNDGDFEEINGMRKIKNNYGVYTLKNFVAFPNTSVSILIVFSYLLYVDFAFLYMQHWIEVEPHGGLA